MRKCAVLYRAAITHMNRTRDMLLLAGDSTWNKGGVGEAPHLPSLPSKLMELPVVGAWNARRQTLLRLQLEIKDVETKHRVSQGPHVTGRCVCVLRCVCVEHQVGQLWLTHVTRCRDSRGIAEEEEELDGEEGREEERRMEIWQTGGVWGGRRRRSWVGGVTENGYVWDEMWRFGCVYCYAPTATDSCWLADDGKQTRRRLLTDGRFISLLQKCWKGDDVHSDDNMKHDVSFKYLIIIFKCKIWLMVEK